MTVTASVPTTAIVPLDAMQQNTEYLAYIADTSLPLYGQVVPCYKHMSSRLVVLVCPPDTSGGPWAMSDNPSGVPQVAIDKYPDHRGWWADRGITIYVKPSDDEPVSGEPSEVNAQVGSVWKVHMPEDARRRNNFPLDVELLAAPSRYGNSWVVLRPDGNGWRLDDDVPENIRLAYGATHRGSFFYDSLSVTPMPVPDPQTPEQLANRIASLLATVDRLTRRNDTLAEQVSAHEAWKEQLTSDAHRMADREGWCETFDSFMEEHDLEPRSREYTVTVDVTYRVDVTVEARNDSEATDSVVENIDDWRDSIVNAAQFNSPEDISHVETEVS